MVVRGCVRTQVFPAVNKAVLLNVNSSEEVLQFGQFVDLPGGQSKFAVRWDPISAAYITLSNVNTVMGASMNPGREIDCEVRPPCIEIHHPIG